MEEGAENESSGSPLASGLVSVVSQKVEIGARLLAFAIWRPGVTFFPAITSPRIFDSSFLMRDRADRAVSTVAEGIVGSIEWIIKKLKREN